MSFAAAAVSLTLLVGACGSSSETDSAESELPTLETSDDGKPDAAAGEESTGSEGEAVASEVDPEEAMARYEACMADLGFEIQTGVAGGVGATLEDVEPSQPAEGVSIDDLNIEDFEAAEAECGAILDEAFGEFELSPEQEAEMADQMLAMQRCLADEGFEIDMQDNGFELTPDIDFEEFDAALQRCQPTDGVFADPSDQ